MINCVVFDFDGVIVDTPKIYFQTMGNFLERHGLKLSREELSRLITFSFHQEFEFLKEKHGLEMDFEHFKKETLLESRKLMEKELQLVPGILGLIVSLTEKNIRLGIASNNNRTVVEWAVARLGVKKYFDSIVCMDSVKNPKPFPDVYLKNAELLAVSPSECAGIEDSAVGCQAVKNAGFYCIGLHNGFTKPSDLLADLVVEKLSELSVEKILSLGVEK